MSWFVHDLNPTLRSPVPSLFLSLSISRHSSLYPSPLLSCLRRAPRLLIDARLNPPQVFTGGSGKAGRHAIPYLLSQGHKVLNLDLIPFPDPEAGVYTLKTDLTDSGQCFNALSSHFDMSGYEDAEGPGKVDAVVHFAGK